jgi:homocysteine S-methyltransferase
MLALDRVTVLDGGLATELEARGHDLSGGLWSARLLRDDPGAVEEAHLAFFRADARIAITASYQASFAGWEQAGIGQIEAAALMRRSVALAAAARERRLAEAAGSGPLLVAASVGPYAATLADGSEYRGTPDVSASKLAAFHGRRLEVLAAAGADLLAIETLPSAVEASVLAGLLGDHPGTAAWISFTCRDGRFIADGTPIEEAVAAVAGAPGLVAVGVNCTAPAHVEELLSRARSVMGLPLVAYPNAGRVWDAPARVWRGEPAAFPVEAALRWRDLGARLIGGCCGVGPGAIGALAARI